MEKLYIGYITNGILTTNEIKLSKTYADIFQLPENGKMKLSNEYNHIIEKEFVLSSGTSLRIIFEIVKDVNGVEYAREIVTKRLFPLSSNLKAEYTLTYEPDINKEDYILVEKINTSKIPNVEVLNFIVASYKRASAYEINAYLNKYCNKKLSKTGTFLNKIQKLESENLYTSEIILEKESKQDNKIKFLRTSIEYSLEYLEKKDENTYNNYNEKYYEILNQDSSYVKINVNEQELKTLDSNLKIEVLVKEKKAINFQDLLNNYKNEYKYNFINDNKITIITINNINYITELFMDVESQIDIATTNDIYDSIATLYLFELINHNGDYKTLDLRYINMFITRMVEITKKLMLDTTFDKDYYDYITEETLLSILPRIEKYNEFKMILERKLKNN